jgi:hypothetical protein
MKTDHQALSQKLRFNSASVVCIMTEVDASHFQETDNSDTKMHYHGCKTVHRTSDRQLVTL